MAVAISSCGPGCVAPPPKEARMISLKTMLTVAAVGVVLSTPAFAQTGAAGGVTGGRGGGMGTGGIGAAGTGVGPAVGAQGSGRPPGTTPPITTPLPQSGTAPSPTAGSSAIQR